MLSCKTTVLDLTINVHSNIQHRVLDDWKDINESQFSNLSLSMKSFASSCIRTHLTVATGISTGQRQSKMKISVPKSTYKVNSVFQGS